jgi:hypothetical protein
LGGGETWAAPGFPSSQGLTRELVSDWRVGCEMGKALIISESVEQRAYARDGAPVDYWQFYHDDKPSSGPVAGESAFTFPIGSAWVTKRLAAPRSQYRRAVGMVLPAFAWLLLLGLLGVLRGSLGLVLLGGLAFVLSMRPLYSLCLAETVVWGKGSWIVGG